MITTKDQIEVVVRAAHLCRTILQLLTSNDRQRHRLIMVECRKEFQELDVFIEGLQ